MPPKKIVGVSENGSEPSQDSAPPQPAPKRARNAQSRVKGKKGALKRVLDLPVDLIWEICSHLDVQGLLALSNTNKSFRTVVTGESSKAFFKRARERIEMPELLLPMSDLRYATLIYGKGCNICGNSNAGKVDPSFRARICSACLKKDFTDPQADESKEKMEEFNEFAKYCATYTTAKSGHDSSCYLVDLKRISKELDAKFPIISRNVLAAQARWESQGSKESKEIVVSGIKTSVETRLIVNGHRLLRGNKGTSSAPEDEFQTWCFERNEELKLREKDAGALDKWLKKMEKKKAEANKQLRLGRRQDIERRFEALGFDKAEFDTEEFVGHPQVKTSRPLSDRTFTSTVEPAIRPISEDKRRERIKSILDDQYSRFVKSHSEKEYFPPATIYLKLPQLESVLDDVSQYPRRSLTLPSPIKAAVSEEISKLIRACREKLLRSIVSAYLELAQELAKKQKNVQQEQEEEEEEEEAIFWPAEFTSIDQLPLTLPRLPPWIPRKDTQPILAGDEQLVSFLESSPLAHFECIECRKLFNTRDLLAHVTSRRGCSYFFDYFQNRDQWVTIAGVDEVDTPQIKMDKNVLSLSLKLRQVVKSTPLQVQESKRLPDLGPDYSMGEENPDWYKVLLRCVCEPFGQIPYSEDPVARMYEHLVNKETSKQIYCRLKSFARYSDKYISRWRSLREAKRVATGGAVDSEYESDEEVDEDFDWGSIGSIPGFSSDVEDGEKKGECVVM
ncbi:hypothetical protein JCM3765_004512 [Sporobolomyces pararoseus]